mgnify:CR=1 FL=1
MSATIARAQGFKKDGMPQNKDVTRLGQGGVRTVAATWHTFCEVQMNADGSGQVILRRDGHGRLDGFNFGPEQE